jgi:CheY-like chemotaxis protein
VNNITNNQNNNIREKIVDFLKTVEIGASSTDIAKQIQHNRLTVSKYLEVLAAQNMVTQQEFGQSKLWKIADEHKKPNILVVDDEPHVVNLIKLSLASGEFNVFEAYSGREALNILKKNQMDLIVLDLMMPGMTGYDVCKAVKENPLTSHIHIIILSAKGEIKDKIDGIDVGADDYIMKPFDPLELEARINLNLKHSSHKDKHPITKLPSKSMIVDHINKSITSNNDFNIYGFKILGLEKFALEKGYKKHNELLVLFKRLVENNLIEKEYFMGHTLKNNFVLVGGIKDIDEEIKEGFEKMLPYIDPNFKSLKLDVNMLSMKDISSNNLNSSQIIDQICN